MESADPNRLLRHSVATLAYRGLKAVRGFPPAHASTRVSPKTRTPHELISHLGDLMRWAITIARGEVHWTASPAASFEAGVEQFLGALAALDAVLAAAPLEERRAEQLLQGPIADALTHVGQLALVRGMVGAPVKPESYARAEIVVGRVGRAQAPARSEFDGDASAAT